MLDLSAMRVLAIVLIASGWTWSCDRSPSSPTSSSIPEVRRETVPTPVPVTVPPTVQVWGVDAGVYTLTVAAASECGNGLGESKLPDDLRSRSYTAMLSRKGETVWVAPRLSYEQGFWGTLSATGATFRVQNPDDGQPMGERLSDSRFFTFEGDVEAAGSLESRLAGTFSGQLILFDTTVGPSWRRIASCTSMSHHFALSR